MPKDTTMSSQNESRRSLEELKQKARLALEHPQLIEIAKTQTPTKAPRRAMKAGFKKDLACSCRFLAVIYRDHGNSVFEEFIKETLVEKT